MRKTNKTSIKIALRRTVSILLLIVLVCSSLTSPVGATNHDQYVWDDVGIDNPSGYWMDIATSANGQDAVALSSPDAYVTNDSGATWNRVTSPSNKPWRAAAISDDGTKMLIAASINTGEYLYLSTDSGATWQTLTNAGSRRWSNIAMSADGSKIYALTEYGSPNYLMVSEDGGATWAQRSVPAATIHTITVADDGSRVYIAHYSGGYIYRSTDQGINWTQLTAAGSKGWRELACSTNCAKIFARDSSGPLMNSTDNGDSWSSQAITAPTSWSDLDVSSDGTKLLVTSGYNPSLESGNRPYTSTDSGASWQVINVPAMYWRAGAMSSDGSTAYVTSNVGFISRSLDNMTSWDDSSSPSTTTENEWAEIVTSVDGQTVYAAAWYGSYIYRSTNGGTTWEPLEQAGFKSWDNLATSDDGQTVLAAAGFTWSAGYLHISRDGGNTWESKLTDTWRDWTNLSVSADGSIMLATDFDGSIYTSTNSGTDWTLRPSAGVEDWIASDMSADGGTMLIAANGYIRASYDHGLTWNQLTAAGSRDWMTISCSRDCSTILGGVDTGYIYVSKNGGSTWTESQSLGTGRWGSSNVSPDGTKIAMAKIWASSPVYISFDDGSTWITQTGTALPSDSWTDFAFSGDGTVLYGVTDGYSGTNPTGRIYRAELISTVPSQPIANSSTVSINGRRISGLNGTYGSTMQLTVPVNQYFTSAVTASGSYAIDIPGNVSLQNGMILTLVQISAAGTASTPTYITVTDDTLAATGQDIQSVVRLAVATGISGVTVVIGATARAKSQKRTRI